MLQPARDAAYNVKTSNSALSTDTVAMDPNSTFGAINGSGYTIEITAFDNVANTVSYTLTENPPVPGSLVSGGATVPWSKATGFAVTGMPGLSLHVKGTPSVPPAANDTITVDPNASIFSTIDHAVNDINSATNSNGANQAVTQALRNIDISMSRISAVRGQAGDLLNRADTITSTNDKRNVEQQANRSRAEDIDMMQAVSDFQRQQTGFQAALQSYAQIQKLSLFNFIG
jgi:flagellar hook-associated protein 3 FlgL